MSVVVNPATLPEPPLIAMPFRERVRTIRNFHTAGEVFRDLAGPVTRTTLGPLVPTMVWVASPQGARDVLTHHDGSVDKNTLFLKQIRLLGGLTVFSLAHEPWIPRRRLLQPLFTKKHVESFAGHMSAAAASMAGEWRDDEVVDLDSASRRLTLRVLGRTLFGFELDREADRLAEPLRDILTYVTARGLGIVRLPLWVPTPRERAWRRGRDIVWRVIDGSIEAARSAPGRSELLDLLLAARDPDTGEPLTDEQLRDELLVFLVAGHDTTATTLAHALWQLGTHPHVQDAVAREAKALGSGPISTRDVASLPVTMRVLHEALRLCPPGAVTARSVERDIAVDGFRVDAGSDILVAIWALHRDPAIWGPDADRFDPNRFLPERSDGRDRWAFLPFGGGNRSCLGDHFAMAEATIALATLVRDAEFTSQADEFPVIVPFTTVAAGPVLAHVRRRR